MPLVVILALVFTLGGSGSPHSSSSGQPTALPPVSVPAPAVTDDATVSTCAQVISALPLTLAGASLRLTTSAPPSSSIVAWGDPPIVLRCGVSKPAGLNPSNTLGYVDVNGVLFLPDRESGDITFTIVDRSVYIDVKVPHSYPQPPLGPIADAVLKVLPKSVCTDNLKGPTARLCTRRK